MSAGGGGSVMSSIVVKNPASQQAIAALRADPRFADAMRASATGIVAMHEGKGSHLLNWLMDDRGRLLFGYIALYLHFVRDPADPSSGLTPTRMKELCAEQDICSAGRATAMLSLMRFAGYLALDESVADRRQRPLLATPKLIALIVQRLHLHFSAMAPLLADGEMLSPVLATADVLYRLFHEDGVRIYSPTHVHFKCRCSREKVVNILRTIPRRELEEVCEKDGQVSIKCEFCSEDYVYTAEQLDEVYGDLTS